MQVKFSVITKTMSQLNLGRTDCSLIDHEICFPRLSYC